MKTQIGFNEISHVLKYIPQIDSLINLFLSSQKWKNIFSYFNENPFSLTEKTIEFFPNIQTLHLFKKEDQKLVTKSIQHYVYWYPLSYKQYKTENKIFKRDEHFSTKSVQFKSVIYNKEDREEFFIVKNKIPRHCQEIGENCFGEVEELEEIDIPNTILRLGNNCFYWCYGLESVVIPNSITSIGNKCFACCESLQSIQFSSSVKTIGNKCFHHCWMLSRIELPDSVISIGDKCFANCTNLNEIEISNNLTSIGYKCFDKCHQLTKIIASNDWKNEGNKLFNTKRHLCSFEIHPSVVFLNKRRIKVVDLIVYKIPSNVTSLGNYCFSRCKKLKKLIIPSSVKTIGDYCFNDCPSLKEIVFSSSIQSFGKNCFYKCGIEESKPLKSSKTNQDCQSNDLNKSIHSLLNKINRESFGMSNDQLITIERWSGKEISKIIFDSNVDDYELNNSSFDMKIVNKSNILIMIKTEKEHYFGCCVNGTIDKIRNWISPTNGFLFSINNETKMKYELKENEQQHLLYVYPSKCYNQLMKIGYHDIIISKDNSFSSLYQNNQSSFDYQGKKEAIFGKTGRECFCAKRIIVCEMK